MSSPAEAPGAPPSLRGWVGTDSLEDAWDTGATFANHPRVRRTTGPYGSATLHRYSKVLPSGIGALTTDPVLADTAGLLHLDDAFYVMAFREGEPLDRREPPLDLVSPITSLMQSLWSTPSPHTEPARRELPVMAPITLAQYVQMPDAVLVTASQHHAEVQSLLGALDARGSGSFLIHGDLKADNVIRSTASQVNLIDWECCGVGHPEDDVASLLASQTIYAIGRAVRAAAHRSKGGGTARELRECVDHELDLVQQFSIALLSHIKVSRPVEMPHLGEAFLLSLLCRLQGLQFVPTSEALRLAATQVVDHSLRQGPEAASSWLHGDSNAGDR